MEPSLCAKLWYRHPSRVRSLCLDQFLIPYIYVLCCPPASSSVSPEAVSHFPLGEFINLQTLSLRQTACYELWKFPCLKGLKSLYLSHNRITRLTYLTPQNVPQLRHLDLSNNPIASLDVLEPLSKLPFLKHLQLDGCPVQLTQDYSKQIWQVLPFLHTLDGRDRYGQVVVKRLLSADDPEKPFLEDQDEDVTKNPPYFEEEPLSPSSIIPYKKRRAAELAEHEITSQSRPLSKRTKFEVLNAPRDELLSKPPHFILGEGEEEEEEAMVAPTKTFKRLKRKRESLPSALEDAPKEQLEQPEGQISEEDAQKIHCNNTKTAIDTNKRPKRDDPNRPPLIGYSSRTRDRSGPVFSL